MTPPAFLSLLLLLSLLVIVPMGAVIIFTRQRKEFLKRQMKIQSQTMKHIGREIHDNVGQKLTLSSLYLEQLAFEDKVPQVHEDIHNINTIIRESLEELRQLSKSLTDDTIEQQSISELLENECEKISKLKKCRVSFTNPTEVVLESYQVKSILLRITQEFLQNSIKHAHCKNIFVSLEKVKKRLQLVLRDDGKGFNTDALKTKGIGLKNIKKRIELINGSFHLESRHNLGTTLTLEVPVEMK